MFCRSAESIQDVEVGTRMLLLLEKDDISSILSDEIPMVHVL